MNNLATSQIPGWLDSWVFGITYVGPLTAAASLFQAYSQEVQLDSIAGSFQVSAPTGMLVNDRIRLVDIGNNIANAPVTFSSAAAGIPLQSPATLVIGGFSYAFGTAEANGAALEFQLVQDPNLGLYLKYIPASGISTNTNVTPTVITGSTNAIGVGNTITVANAASAVGAQIVAGGSNGEKKTFKVGAGAAILTVTTASSMFINGVAASSFQLQGIGSTQDLIWVGGGINAWIG